MNRGREAPVTGAEAREFVDDKGREVDTAELASRSEPYFEAAGVQPDARLPRETNFDPQTSRDPPRARL